MRERCGIFVLVLWTVLILFTRANASTQEFYASLVSSIEDVQGTVVLDLAPGLWKTEFQRPSSATLIWRFAENSRAVVDFDFRDGVLQQGARIDFRPAINVWVKARGIGFSALVTSIDYDEFGHPAVDLTLDNPGTNNPALMRALENAVTLDRSPRGLFSALPFRNLPMAASCSDPSVTTCSGSQRLVTRIDFEKRNNNQEGLSITLRDQSTLVFNDDNRITFNGPATVSMESLVFDPDADSTIYGTLDRLHAQISRGQLASQGISLGIQSSLAFDVSQLFSPGSSRRG